MTQAPALQSPKRDYETALLLLGAALFWSLVIGTVLYYRPVWKCALELESDITQSCSQALQKPLVPQGLKTELAQKHAERLMVAEDFQGVIAATEPLVKAGSANDTVLNLRGRAFQSLEKYDEAADAFKAALALQPDNQDHFITLVSFLRDRDLLDEAVQVTEDYAARNPQSNQAYYWWGYLEETRGNHRASIDVYDRAAKLDPTDHYSMKGKARAFVELKEYDAALAEYGKAIEASQSEPYSIELRGRLYHRLGLHAEAQADFKRMLALENSPNVRNLLAESYIAAKDYAAAKPVIDEALAMEGDNIGALIALAQWHLQQGQFDEAAGAALKMKEYTGHEASYWAAQIDAARGNTEAAIAAYRTLLQTWSGHGELRAHLGHALLDAKRTEEALKAFDEAIAWDPNSAFVHSGRARVYLELARWKDAETAASRALSFSPRDGIAFARRGMARGKLKMYDEAQQDFLSAQSIEPLLVWPQVSQFEMLLEARKFEDAALVIASLENTTAGPAVLADLRARLKGAQESAAP